MENKKAVKLYFVVFYLRGALKKVQNNNCRQKYDSFIIKILITIIILRKKTENKLNKHRKKMGGITFVPIIMYITVPP